MATVERRVPAYAQPEPDGRSAVLGRGLRRHRDRVYRTDLAERLQPRRRLLLGGRQGQEVQILADTQPCDSPIAAARGSCYSWYW